MQEKRLTHRLTEYWNQMRDEGALPSWEKFDSSSFSQLWKQCCGWKIDASQTNTIIYTYEYAGSALKAITGADLTGKQISSNSPDENSRKTKDYTPPGGMLISHFHNFPAARILQKLDRTVRKPAIVIEEGRVIDAEGKHIRFRSCLLPFGGQDGKVTHMVMGLSWKEY